MLEGVDFPRDGFAILPGIFGQPDIDGLIDALPQAGSDGGVRSRGGVYAVRNLLQLSPAVHELARSSKVLAMVAESLGRAAFPVRGTLFDKTTGANWLVPWHQDLTVCVVERRDVPAYGPW